ncbi:MAG: hypothetical protein ABSF63_12290 [Candidatus Bathyarchaeia archaeon]|jgi:hypothetical protein
MRINFAFLRRFDLRLVIVFAVGMVVRIAYAVAAPLSPDWQTWYSIGIYFYSQPGLTIAGTYTIPPYIFAALYAIWLRLPISHPYPGSIVTFPSQGGMPPYFQPTPDAILFVLIMKLPVLIADAVIAILFYKMLLDSGVSKNRTYFAVAAWLLNPLTLVLGNVNDVDTIPLMLVVFSAFLVEKKRYGLATFSLIAAGLMRLLAFIALPYLIVKTARARDWAGILSTTVPIAAVFIPLLSWLALFRPDAIALFQGRPGLYVPEALDVFGSVLQMRGTEYPENAIALTTLAYILILALITRRSSESRLGGLVSAPFLAYTAFSWVWPSMLIYGIAFGLIEIARGKGYRTLTVLITLAGFLWILVQEGGYICKENVSFLFIPLYNATLQGLSNQCLNLYALVLNGGLSVPIRGVFSAVIALLIIRLVSHTTDVRANTCR